MNSCPQCQGKLVKPAMQPAVIDTEHWMCEQCDLLYDIDYGENPPKITVCHERR